MSVVAESFFTALTRAIESLYQIQYGVTIPQVYLATLQNSLGTTFSMNIANISMSTITTAITTLVATHPITSTTTINSALCVPRSVDTPHILNRTIVNNADTPDAGSLATGKLVLTGGSNFNGEGAVSYLAPTLSTGSIMLPNTTYARWNTVVSSAQDTAECSWVESLDVFKGIRTCTAGPYVNTGFTYTNTRTLTALTTYPMCLVNKYKTSVSAGGNPGSNATLLLTTTIPSSMEAVTCSSTSFTVNASTGIVYYGFRLYGKDTVSGSDIATVVCVLPSVSGSAISDVCLNGNVLTMTCVIPFTGSYYAECTTISAIVTSLDSPKPSVDARNMIRSMLERCTLPYSKWSISSFPNPCYINGYGPFLQTAPTDYVTASYDPTTGSVIVDPDMVNSSLSNTTQLVLYLDKTQTIYWGTFTPSSPPTVVNTILSGSTIPFYYTAFSDIILNQNFVNSMVSKNNGLQLIIHPNTGISAADATNINALNMELSVSSTQLNTFLVNREIEKQVVPPIPTNSPAFYGDLLWQLPALIFANATASQRYIERRYEDLKDSYSMSSYYGNGVNYMNYDSGIYDPTMATSMVPPPSVLMAFALIGFHTWNAFRASVDINWLQHKGFDIITYCTRVCMKAFENQFSGNYAISYNTLRNLRGSNDTTTGKTSNILITSLVLNCIIAYRDACYQLQIYCDQDVLTLLTGYIQLPIAPITGTLFAFQDIESLNTCWVANSLASTSGIPTTVYSEVLQALHPLYVNCLLTQQLSIYVSENIAPYVLNYGSTYFTNAMYNTNVQFYVSNWTSTTDLTSMLSCAACQAYAAQWLVGSFATTSLDASYTWLIKAMNLFDTNTSLPMRSCLLFAIVSGILGMRFFGKVSSLFALTETFGIDNTGNSSYFQPTPFNSVYMGASGTSRVRFLATTP